MPIQNNQMINRERLLCHRCAYLNPRSDLLDYGSFKLCRICAGKYEESREKGKVKSIEEFVLVD